MSNTVDSQTRVIGQAMSDPAFRKRLLADPVGTLRGAGVEVPEGLSVEVVEDTATRVHLVLPAPIEDSALADRDLDAAIGAAARCGGATQCLNDTK
ncbi:MAG TPA: NHLP leader peptide family RiPP precursor [Phenylobacterium sp.]|jgi:hypothetical protein|nr:NHLP leader peptide family RiPP precursor [Phenylobacterium sp.]